MSRKNKKWWAEALEKYEKLLSFVTETKTKHELTKRELEKWISAKNFCDVVELICQGCGEQIFGMVCDLCGYNNDISSKILKIGKEEILYAEKRGIVVDAEKTALKDYENIVIEKKKNDEIEQFILNTINTWESCKECGKNLDGTICENCGFDNKEHKKATMIQGMQKLSEYYNIPFKEAAKVLQVKMHKLRDEGKIYIK